MREAFRFYCYSDDELVDLFERFRTEFPATEEEYVHDCENVWEWIEGQTSDQLIRFNIHRPHVDLDEFGIETVPNPECPV